MPQNEQVLIEQLGSDYSKWPNKCLIDYPREFDSQIDIVKQALTVAESKPKYASDLVRTINEQAMKRWFIDVALWSGAWRAKLSGVSDDEQKVSHKRQAISQKRLEALFERDKWRCRYCGIRVAGNRKHFVKFAKAIRMPELVAGRTDETRHGLYLMLMASHDHVKSHSEGGSNEDSNLVTSCWGCQFGKYKYSLEALRLNNPLKTEPVMRGDWNGLRFV